MKQMFGDHEKMDENDRQTDGPNELVWGIFSCLSLDFRHYNQVTSYMTE